MSEAIDTWLQYALYARDRRLTTCTVGFAVWLKCALCAVDCSQAVSNSSFKCVLLAGYISVSLFCFPFD